MQFFSSIFYFLLYSGGELIYGCINMRLPSWRCHFFLSGPESSNVLVEFRWDGIALFSLIRYSGKSDGPEHNVAHLKHQQTDLVLTDNLGAHYNLVSRCCLEQCYQNSVWKVTLPAAAVTIFGIKLTHTVWEVFFQRAGCWRNHSKLCLALFHLQGAGYVVLHSMGKWQAVMDLNVRYKHT